MSLNSIFFDKPNYDQLSQEGKKYFEKKCEDNELNCVICLDPTLDPVATKCGQVFCRICLDKALSDKKICPSCRRPFTLKEVSGCNERVKSLNRIVEKALKKDRAERKSEEKSEENESKNVDSEPSVKVVVNTGSEPTKQCAEDVTAINSGVCSSSVSSSTTTKRPDERVEKIFNEIIEQFSSQLAKAIGSNVEKFTFIPLGFLGVSQHIFDKVENYIRECGFEVVQRKTLFGVMFNVGSKFDDAKTAPVPSELASRSTQRQAASSSACEDVEASSYGIVPAQAAKQKIEEEHEALFLKLMKLISESINKNSAKNRPATLFSFSCNLSEFIPDAIERRLKETVAKYGYTLEIRSAGWMCYKCEIYFTK